MKCQTGVLACVLVVSLVLLAESHAADPPKSAFGEAFDEIVVESTLTVRGKGPSRQSRNKSLTLPKKATAATSTTKPQEASTAEPEKRTRREISHINLPRC
ncbi:hypothetical protein C0J52_04100 [Blattella germanica]|nr:hypothetical protein C0J52_04100 [Blattella germanica]